MARHNVIQVVTEEATPLCTILGHSGAPVTATPFSPFREDTRKRTFLVTYHISKKEIQIIIGTQINVNL